MNKKITELTELTTIADSDLFEVIDVSDNTMGTNGTNKKITKANVVADLSSKTETLTNKTLTSPVINTGVSGTAISTSATLAENSDTILASQKAVKTYADTKLSPSSTISQRINPRTDTVASSATPSINTDTTDIFTITALAAAITSMTTNLTGTPVNGQKLIIRIKDNGTARAITWGASFASRGATLPTTTVLGKYLYVGLIYNSTASVWDCVATSQES